MKHLRRFLGALLMFCVAIRVAAWLVAPAIKGIAILLTLVALLALMVGWGSDL